MNLSPKLHLHHVDDLTVVQAGLVIACLFLFKVASKVGLEAGKSIKLESSEGMGYYLRVTLKVCFWKIPVF